VLFVTSREAYRLAYAAMVLALAVACTPAVEEPAPAAEAPAITPPADTATGPAAPNTTDTLATPAPETAPPDQAAASPAATATPAPSAAAPPAAAPVALTPEELATGRAAYARTCAMCHGAKGEGTPAAAAIVSRDLAVIANKIVKGPINPGDRMPAMSAMLSAAEIEAVAKFVAAGFPQ
jgi:mono/diheme cytochrome c family protein